MGLNFLITFLTKSDLANPFYYVFIPDFLVASIHDGRTSRDISGYAMRFFRNAGYTPPTRSLHAWNASNALTNGRGKYNFWTCIQIVKRAMHIERSERVVQTFITRYTNVPRAIMDFKQTLVTRSQCVHSSLANVRRT